MYLALRKCENDGKILKITLVQIFVLKNLKLLDFLSDSVLNINMIMTSKLYITHLSLCVSLSLSLCLSLYLSVDRSLAQSIGLCQVISFHSSFSVTPSVVLRAVFISLFRCSYNASFISTARDFLLHWIPGGAIGKPTIPT